MEAIKKKMGQLREEADAALTRAEEAEAKNKKLEQLLLEHETLNKSLASKVDSLEEKLDDSEKNRKEAVEKLQQIDLKAEQAERQVQSLEKEREKLEKKLEDALEKYKTSKAELDDLVANMEGL